MTSARKRNEDSSVQEQMSAVPAPEAARIFPGLPPANKSSVPSSPTESWRELAQRIQKETNPAVMIELTHELIAKLDEEKSRKPRGK